MPVRPNFLFIMTDQQRGDCLGIEGHPVLLTPNMDSIAGNGVRFSKAYTTCPSCIAARRSILSGQFPPTHGMVGYRDGIEWDAPPTLPGVLSRAGYHTYHVGRSMHQHPCRKRYGFDHIVTHGWETDYGAWLEKHQPPGAGGYYGTGVMHNDWTAHPWHMDESLHQTNWTVNETIDFLKTRRDPSCPFFVTCSFIAPHPPLVPPGFYYYRYYNMDLPKPVIGDWASPPPNDGKGMDVAPSQVKLTGEALRACRAAYYGLINHVDDQIRRILNGITGINRRDTVVIFTSDHGEMLGDHYLWRKSVPYEPSARIPLLIEASDDFGIKRGHVCDAPVCLEDLMPTILDMAGVPIPETAEGRSLLPLLRGEQPAWRSHVHIEHAPQHHSLTDGREKFIWWVRDGREQFFDLTTDPNECRDLIADPVRAARIAEWRGLLIDELRDRPEGFTSGGALIAGRPYPAVLPHGGKQA